MSNIAESFKRMGKVEFQQCLVVARTSCAVARSQLYIALDVGYTAQKQFDQIHSHAEEVARLIGGLRASH